MIHAVGKRSRLAFENVDDANDPSEAAGKPIEDDPSGSAPGTRRQYRGQRIETPSHPGGVNEQVRQSWHLACLMHLESAWVLVTFIALQGFSSCNACQLLPNVTRRCLLFDSGAHKTLYCICGCSPVASTEFLLLFC